MTRRIEIPGDYFARVAQKEYSDDAGIALIRELLQNSCDAGAKTVSFNFRDRDILIVEDDGHGMNLVQMQKRMLTPLASEKAEGAVGGFGKAKELILFGNPGWSIRSQDAYVAGEYLTVTSECSALSFERGALFGLTLPPSLYSAAKRWARITLQSSEREGVVFMLDGDSIDCSVKRSKRCVKDFGFAKAYVNRDNADTAVYLRTGGLLTSRRSAYHPRAVGQVIIEVQGKSCDLLTPARDDFRSTDHRAQVNQWLTSLVTEARTALAEDEGDEILFFDEGVVTPDIEVAQSHSEQVPVAAGGIATPVTFRQTGTKTEQPSARSALLVDILTDASPSVAQGVAEALAALDATNAAPAKPMRRTTPKGFDAELLPKLGLKRVVVHTGSKKDGKAGMKWLKQHPKAARTLLAMWATAVTACTKAAGLKLDAVGFTFRADGEAEFLRTNGRWAVLLNPTNFKLDDWCVEELLDRCYHELAHQLGSKWHDESFIMNETRVRRASRSRAIRGAVARAQRLGEVQYLTEEEP